MYEINIGDTVMCIANDYCGVTGVVIKQYIPTGCEEQTMIKCDDGRKFHAPTKYFARINKDIKVSSKVVEIITPSIVDELSEIINREHRKHFERRGRKNGFT